jgi:phosphate-selective porin
LNWPVVTALSAAAILAAGAGGDPEQAPQQAAEDQKKGTAESKKKGGFRFTFTKKDKRPSIRAGRMFRADLRVKQQMDFRLYTPDDRNDETLFDYNRRRFGVEGEFLRHFEYEIEREFRDTDPRWRDFFVNFNYLRRFQVRGGRFKIPFSLDQLTPPMSLDFVYRSRLGDQLAPGRATGLQVHGRLFDRRFRYQAGLFRADGDNARFDQVLPEGGELEMPSGLRTVAGRLTGAPQRFLPSPKLLDTLELGLSVASSNVPEGMRSLRLRSFGRESLTERFFVKGERTRVGMDFVWAPGPFGLKGEYAGVKEQRLGQSLFGLDLSDYLSRAWYVSGTWCITGERKADGLEPKRELISGRGIGALELAARFEVIRFGSAQNAGRPARNTRADNVTRQSDRAWTFGVNWYLNRWSKIQLNGVREKFEDVLSPRNPISGRNRYWMRVVRIQLVL